MKLITTFSLLALIWLGTAWGANDTNYLAGFNWPIGEKITYKLYWGFIPVGTAITWTEWAEYEGKPVLAIRMRTQSNKVVEKIYPVNDFIESLVDTNTFLPLRFSKDMSEGDRKYKEVTLFDRTNKVARWESKISGKKREYAIDPETRDIPSLMYYLRTQNFIVGTQQHFRVQADEKMYDLWLNIKKKEKVDTPNYNKVNSIKIEPEASFNGLFVRKGKIWVWMSSDPRQLATQIEASIPVANVRAIILQVEGPGTDFWIKSDATDKKSP